MFGRALDAARQSENRDERDGQRTDGRRHSPPV
jgi:hypothetical protein